MSGYNTDAMHRRSAGHEHALAKALRRSGISEHGNAFVAMASDPFSDSPIKVVGMPDQTSGKSFVLDIRQELSIRKSAAMEAANPGGNWDAHIAFVPLITDNFAPITLSANGGLTAIAAAVPGPTPNALVHVCKVNEGQNTFDPTVIVATDCEYDGILVPELMELYSRARLIGGGIEVHDDTSALNRQGAVTCYRVDAEASYYTVTNTAGTAKIAGQIGSLPPSSIAQAKQINGVTHNSADGALQVWCLDDVDPRAHFTNLGNAVLVNAGESVPGSRDGFSAIGPAFTDPTVSRHYRELPFMMSGAYFTGLSSVSSLRLTVRCFVEVFPAPGNDLMALAKLAPSADPAAMEMLSILQSATLPGYPVSWNSFGDFTKSLLSTVRSIGKPLIKGIHWVNTAVTGAEKEFAAQKAAKAARKPAPRAPAKAGSRARAIKKLATYR